VGRPPDHLAFESSAAVIHTPEGAYFPVEGLPDRLEDSRDGGVEGAGLGQYPAHAELDGAPYGAGTWGIARNVLSASMTGPVVSVIDRAWSNALEPASQAFIESETRGRIQMQHDEQGRPMTTLEVNADLADRRRAEEKRQDSEQRLRPALTASTSA
jgi:hypothetical protein